MIQLKYKCKVNFVKLPLIGIDLCLKLVFENATTNRNAGFKLLGFIKFEEFH
jgi:hypothetical protein